MTDLTNIPARLNHIDNMLQRILVKLEKVYDNGKERQGEAKGQQEQTEEEIENKYYNSQTNFIKDYKD